MPPNSATLRNQRHKGIQPIGIEPTTNLHLQPPRQQHFSAAKDIAPLRLSRRTASASTPTAQPTIRIARSWFCTDTRGAASHPRGVNFISGTDPAATTVRIPNVEKHANHVLTQLLNLFSYHQTWYKEPCSSAALVGIEINEPCWQREVDLSHLDLPRLGNAPERRSRRRGRFSR